MSIPNLRKNYRRNLQEKVTEASSPSPPTPTPTPLPTPTTSSWVDRLYQAIDDLTISRTSAREEALSVIISTLTLNNASKPLESRIEELLLQLRKILNKGNNARESILAAKAIALVFINHGDASLGDEEDHYQIVARSLRNAVVNSPECELKIQCLISMGIMAFTSASDIDIQLLRNFVFDIIETEGADINLDGFSSQNIDSLTCAALHTYSLLYISAFSEGIIDFDILWEEVEKVMPVHDMLLESSEKDIRVAAGENIALMFETVRVFTENKEEEEDKEDKVQPEYDNMDGLIHTLRTLSVESSRRKNKHDNVEQKSVFRDVIKSVEEGISPVEELKIGERTIVFRGWSKILLLEAFRKIIGQGLQQHLRTNELFPQIFHYSGKFSSKQPNTYEDIDVQGMSRVDKRYVYDEREKSRTRQLRSARNTKEGLEV
ncbi:interferon-related developmental regulator-domain-containing protein [Spinellus fusiger]|nr:interferon-related developmental regulator-domain-containing protein [Spinellus fusiger]